MPLRCRTAHRSSLPRTALAVVGLLALLASQSSAQPLEEAQPLPECEVIARINSEVVLACELDWQVRLMFDQRFGPEAVAMMDKAPQLIAAREELLKQLIIGRIEMALLYADFRSNAPQADLGAIRNQLAGPFEQTEVPRLMKQVGVEDREQLEARLFELGTSVSERREDFVRTTISRQWLQQSVKINKEVTHEQMLEYYHANTEDYFKPARARWEELMVRFDKHGSKRDAYAALARIGNQAHNASANAAVGQPAFAALAPNVSDGFTAEEGGAHDWTTQGSLASGAMNQALASLPVGQMSPIIEGPLGFHIVRVLERQEAGPTAFRDVQGQISRDLRDERFNLAINKKVTELKKSARLWTTFTGDLSYERLAELQGGPIQR